MGLGTRGERGEGREDVLDLDGEQRRIGFGREDVAAAQGCVGHYHVRAGDGRAPGLGRRGSEEDDGGDAVSRREVGGSGVDGDDDFRCRDDRREVAQGENAREGLARTGQFGDTAGAVGLVRASGVDDAVPLGGQRTGDRGEALLWPLPGAVERADVHDGCPGDRRGRGGDGEGDVFGVGVEADGVNEAGPAGALEFSVDPERTRIVGAGARIEPRDAELQRSPRGDLAQPQSRLRTVAVQVDPEFDTPGGHREWVVEAVQRGHQGIQALDQINDRLEPGRGGQDQPVLGEAAAQRLQRGNRHEEVAELEGAQGEDLRSPVRVGESAHGASFLSGPPYPVARDSDARSADPFCDAPEQDDFSRWGFTSSVSGYEEGVNDSSLRSADGADERVRTLRGILFDRDATLVVDVPYNGDPSRVSPMPTALDAVERAREAGLALGVVTNQSGIARGLLDRAQAEAVNRRVDELFGGFDVWMLCPHGPDDGCACRKPAPGMVLDAAEALGLPVDSLAVIGDIGADMGAAAAAGARGVLVPTPVTRSEEVAAAPLHAATLLEAVELLLAMQPDGDSE